MDVPGPAWIREHLEAGRHRALAERVAGADLDLPTVEAVRAALAWIGLAPAYELVVAARAAHGRGDAETPLLARRATWLLARLGAATVARALADELTLLADDVAELERLTARVRADEPVEDAVTEAALAPGFDAGDPAALAALADDVAAPARLRGVALARLLAEAARSGDVARARARADAAVAIAPDGDDGDQRRLQAALWAWRASDRPAAVGLARRVAADLRAAKPSASGRMLLADVEAVLASIDRDDATCAWIAAAPAPAPTAAPTAAHLVRALAAAGQRPVRVTATIAMAAAVLAGGGALWLELRGARRLIEVRGVDATAGVVALDDGAGGLAWWPQLERASGPFGLGGVAVAAGVDVAADPRLPGLDACDVDDDGHAPPRGFVFHTARTALAAHPTWARALWRWGQELTTAHASGHATAADVVRWYGQAREHVAHAPWTFAAYAQVLADQGRRQEAALAWRDALLRDPEDVELAIACGQALHAAGRAGSALAALAPALVATAPEPRGHAAAAEALLAQDATARARAAAELALDRDPAAVGAGHALVSCLERGGERTAARATLDRLRAASPGHGGLALRAAIAAARAGAWTDALAAADALLGLARNPSTVALTVRLACCAGDAGRAWADVTAGLGEYGVDDGLVTQATALLAAMPAADAARALDEVTAGLAPAALAAWAYALSEQELHPLAIAMADRAAAAGPDVSNARWHAARCRLRAGDGDRARMRAELEHVIGVATGFSLGRLALAVVTLDDDPAAALAAVEPGLHDLTPLGWSIEARALAALGRADESAAVLARLHEAASSIGAQPINAARLVGAPAEAARVAAIARGAGVTAIGVVAEHAAALVASGDLDGAAVALAGLTVRDEDGPDHLIARTALAAGVPAVATAAADRALLALRDTRRWDLDDAMDPWWYEAVRAVAAEPAVATAARAEVIRGAPAHPTAWAVLAGGRRGAPGRADDRAHLAAIAPGLAIGGDG